VFIADVEAVVVINNLFLKINKYMKNLIYYFIIIIRLCVFQDYEQLRLFGLSFALFRRRSSGSRLNLMLNRKVFSPLLKHVRVHVKKT
jgi:hypothetical protein